MGWQCHQHDWGQTKEPDDPLWFGAGLRQPVEVQSRAAFQDFDILTYRRAKLLPPPPPRR